MNIENMLEQLHIKDYIDRLGNDNSDILLNAIAVLSNQLKLEKEKHAKYKRMFEIRQQELEDIYRVNGNIRQCIKFASDNLIILRDMINGENPRLSDISLDIEKIVERLAKELPIELGE